MKALGAVDRITGKDENVRVIEEALETALREKPLWFFTNIIMPLLPRETRAAVEAGDNPTFPVRHTFRLFSGRKIDKAQCFRGVKLQKSL